MMTAAEILAQAEARAVAAARRVVEIADAGGRVEDALARLETLASEHGYAARLAARSPERLEAEYAESVGPCPFL